MVTVALLLMSKTRLALLPLMVSLFAPGPSMAQVVGDAQLGRWSDVMVPCRPVSEGDDVGRRRGRWRR